MKTRQTEARDPEGWRVELHTEQLGVQSYAYRHLVVERAGRRCSARELTLQLDYDSALNLLTPPRRMLRVRGRSLVAEERDLLEARLASLAPRLAESYPCCDDRDPTELDPSLGPDGVPIAVSLGEEGPACLTLRLPGQAARRVLVERFRAPGLEATLPGAARRAPLAALLAHFDAGLRATQRLNYRRADLPRLLSEEFSALKAVHFLNLRGFERRGIEALGASGDPGVLPALSAELFAPDPQVRLLALDALASVGGDEAAAEVELLCWSDDWSVRDRAREVLERLKAPAR